MQGLIFREKGSIDNLKLEELPEPIPAANEVVVELKASSINPSDFKNVLGKINVTTVPRIPGRDFSGIVIAGPSEWIGKEVFGMGEGIGLNRNGTHAQRVAVPIEALVIKPSFLAHAEAAALTLSYMTAWSAIVDSGKIKAGETILISGTTGAVGSAAVRIAKLKGARVIGTLRHGNERSKAKDLPVDHWIALDESELPKAVKELTNGRGAELVLDLVGGPLFEPCILSLAQRGRQIALASSEPRVSFNIVDFYHREASLIGLQTAVLTYAQCAATLRSLLPGFKEGILKVPEIEIIGLEKAIEGYRLFSEGKTKKKFVIQFS